MIFNRVVENITDDDSEINPEDLPDEDEDMDEFDGECPEDDEEDW